MSADWSCNRPAQDGWYWFQDAEAQADPCIVHVLGGHVEMVGCQAWVPVEEFRETVQWKRIPAERKQKPVPPEEIA